MSDALPPLTTDFDRFSSTTAFYYFSPYHYNGRRPRRLISDSDLCITD
jgi:hypothetical protein